MGIHNEVQGTRKGGSATWAARCRSPPVLQPSYGSKRRREGEKQRSRRCAGGLKTAGTGERPVRLKENLADCLCGLSPRIGNVVPREGEDGGKEEAERGEKKQPETSQGKADVL